MNDELTDSPLEPLTDDARRALEKPASESVGDRLYRLCEHWMFVANGGTGRPSPDYLDPDDDEKIRTIQLIRSLMNRAETELVMQSGDGEFDPTKTRVYWYANHSNDSCPSHGYLEFDEARGDFVFPFNCETVFIKREGVTRYIESRRKTDEE